MAGRTRADTDGPQRGKERNALLSPLLWLIFKAGRDRTRALSVLAQRSGSVFWPRRRLRILWPASGGLSPWAYELCPAAGPTTTDTPPAAYIHGPILFSQYQRAWNKEGQAGRQGRHRQNNTHTQRFYLLPLKKEDAVKI